MATVFLVSSPVLPWGPTHERRAPSGRSHRAAGRHLPQGCRPPIPAGGSFPLTSPLALRWAGAERKSRGESRDAQLPEQLCGESSGPIPAGAGHEAHKGVSSLSELPGRVRASRHFLGKTMARNQRETRTHIAIYQRLLLGLPMVAANTLLHIPNGEGRSARTGALLKRMGVRSGAADLMFVWQGRVHFLEVKVHEGPGQPKTYQSQAQREFQANVEDAGAFYAVVRDSDEAIGHCRAWDVPIREVDR